MTENPNKPLNPDASSDVESCSKSKVLTIRFLTNFDCIEDVPSDPNVRNFVDISLVHLVEQSWLSRLSDADTSALKRFREESSENIQPPDAEVRIFDALNDVIFSQARTLGSKLLLCDAVLRRLLKWDSLSNGPRLWERLGREMSTHIRVARGEAKVPLDDGMRALRDDLKREHSLLQRWMRSRRPTSMDTDGLMELTRHHTEENPDSFRRLRANWTLFELFRGISRSG